MIQHPRDMNDLSGFFCTAQNKIIILRTVIPAVKTSRMRDKITLCHQKMADVIVAAQKIRVVIRLEIRLKILASVL